MLWPGPQAQPSLGAGPGGGLHAVRPGDPAAPCGTEAWTFGSNLPLWGDPLRSPGWMGSASLFGVMDHGAPAL